MSNDEITRQNHYVPIWYQKGFAVGGLLHYLDLDPRTLTLPDGRLVRLLDRKPRAPKSCFWELDLYTTRFGNAINDGIEKLLFGSIDDGGARALRGLAVGDGRAIHRGFQDMFGYLGAQKLRTPKGLDWIRAKYPGLTQLELMGEMQYLRQMYGTMWLESVKEVVSAERSDVKFIVTDHPVTVYNPACEPGSQLCGYPNDPSIALAGTQTVFAIDADHLLVLTNLEYAKDPAGVDLLAPRQNARFFGQTIARTDAWIRTRHLSRDQVRSVNFLLKSRARRYVAAGKKEWLHPEAAGPVQWRDVGVALSPPDEELYHFGGEMYFGYKDGTSGYQDAYGRTTGAHEFLQRPEVRSPGPNDLCGCGSGWKFRRCCAGAPAHERPSWRLLSIRERNLGLVNAITDVLGLNKGKTWTDVRRELGDEQVRRIHEVYRALWPPDTNIMELLPRAAHGASSRALYMGFVDPRTVPKTVTSWLTYFDQIVVVNPFTNPAHMKPEFSPIDSPAQYKEQTLKNCIVLLALAQFIAAGTVLCVPDPCEFDPAFREAVMAMTKERARGWRPRREDMDLGERLLRDDYARSLRRLPEASLRRLLKNAPGVNDENIDLVIQHMKRQHEEDPFALLQPLEAGKGLGQMQVLRGVSVELGLFLAQLTGAFIYTDVPAVWQQLHVHATSRQATPSPWAPVMASLERVPFTLELNPQFVAEAGASLRLRHLRAAIRQVWKSARDGRPQSAERLSPVLMRASVRARGAWVGEPSVEPSAQIDQYLELSVPEGGFGRNAVRRLLVLSGRSSYLPAVPMAMLMKDRQSRQPDARPSSASETKED